MPDGTTKTDKATFTAEDLQSAGYFEVDQKPSVDNTKVVTWVQESMSWNVRDKTQEEIDFEIEGQWELIRNERDKLLTETDFIVLKSYEAGVPVPEEYVIYRQELRDIPQSQTDPYNIIWPEIYPES
jgi:hypothetical protein